MKKIAAKMFFLLLISNASPSVAGPGAIDPVHRAHFIDYLLVIAGVQSTPLLLQNLLNYFGGDAHPPSQDTYGVAREIEELLLQPEVEVEAIHNVLSISANDVIEQIDHTNMPVVVQNIHVHPIQRFGEYRSTEPSSADDQLVYRVGRTLERIARLVEAYHRIGMRNQDRNLSFVTQGMTEEYCFCPNNRPFSAEEFDELLIVINEFASSYPQNLILIYSTFSVVRDNMLYNTAIHVQCGERPDIYPFVKSFASGFDPNYLDANTNRDFAKFSEPFSFREGNQAPALQTSGSITRHSVALVSTEEGAKYFNLMEICLDHQFRIGLRSLMHEIREWSKSSLLLPK